MNPLNLITAIFVIIATGNLYGQNKTLVQVTPKSPDVAAFDKYSEIPVSLSTGMIQVQVPLYEVKVGQVSLPITLAYNNNGLRPDEFPTWVGHGWSLRCGGVISYSQQGLNDFDPIKGLFAGGLTQLNSYFANTMNASQRQTFFEDIIAGNIDSEHDIYHYSLPDAAGSFYFINSSDARLNPRADLLVAKTTNGFKLTDASGNEYYFESKEQCSAYNLATDALSGDFSDNSSFYLTKLIAPNGDSVNFRYKQYLFSYTTTTKYISHAGYTHGSCPPSTVGTNDILTTIQYLLPDSIIFRGGYIKFNHTAQLRQDLIKVDEDSDVPSLESIEVYDYNQNKLRKFIFYTSYFGTNDRLRLDSLMEAPGVGSAPGRQWKFSYYGQNSSFPAFFSTAKDHWGYHNANTANTSIPDAMYGSFLPLWQTYSVQYANRTSDAASAMKGMLQSVIYPTGGKSEFEYEANQFKLSSYSNFEFGPFLKLPSSSFTETVVNAHTSNGDTVQGTFTVTDAGYYKISSFKKLSPDVMYQDANVLLQAPSGSYIQTATVCSTSSLWCLTSNEVRYLQPGAYTYAAQGSYWDDVSTRTYLDAWIEIYKESPGTPVPFEVGGCRVSRIKHIDPVTADTLEKRYIYQDSLPYISFKQVPYYVTSIEKYYDISGNVCRPCEGNMFTVHDQSVRPMVGSVIEYGKVIEMSDESGTLGKTEHNFSFSENLMGTLAEPYVAPVNTNWRAGNMIGGKNFAANGSVKDESTNTYSSDYSGTLVNGLKVNYDIFCPGSSDGRTYRVNLATLFSENYKPVSTTSKIYDGTDQLSATKNYTFNVSKHNNPSTISSGNSDSSTGIIKTLFVLDYDSLNLATDVPASALKSLKDKYINAPIEEVLLREIGGTQYVVGGTLKMYKASQSVVDKMYVLKIQAPVPLANFTFSRVTSAGVFIYDSRYVPKASFDLYDSRLNLLEQRLADNVMNAYIWDYRALYPIAETIGATSAEIAYTSFEADGTGNWTFSDTTRNRSYAVTGLRSYNIGSGSVSKSGLTVSSKYIVSYWSRNGSYTISGGTSPSPLQGETVNGWTFYEHLVTASSSTITVSGSGLIDELRLYPEGAQMSTFTYNPLVGVTGTCDAANFVSSYEYDSMGRLARIRDKYGNILKQFDYKFIANNNQ